MNRDPSVPLGSDQPVKTLPRIQDFHACKSPNNANRIELIVS